LQLDLRDAVEAIFTTLQGANGGDLESPDLELRDPRDGEEGGDKAGCDRGHEQMLRAPNVGFSPEFRWGPDEKLGQSVRALGAKLLIPGPTDAYGIVVFLNHDLLSMSLYLLRDTDRAAGFKLTAR
jgi:hypothetical protein